AREAAGSKADYERVFGLRIMVSLPMDLPSRIGREKSRVHSMKRSTAGLSVRSFKVTMLTGQGRNGRSTGNTLSALKYATDRGIEVINLPSAKKWVMTDMDSVTMLAFGIGSPFARKASDKIR